MKKLLLAVMIILLAVMTACAEGTVSQGSPAEDSQHAPLDPEEKVPEIIGIELAEPDAEPALSTPADAETPASKDGTEIFFINVGKGDAILVKTDGKTFLIDGGKAANAGTVLSVLKEEGVARLDAVFLTHTDSDHTGCLPVLESAGIKVENWYASRYYASPKKEEKHPCVTAAALTMQKVIWLSAGDMAEGVFEVLAPLGPMEDEDDNSLVMVLTTAYGRILLTGDMELPEEEMLLASGTDVRCRVLKVPNHADNDAASETFLRATGATIAVISTSPAEKPGTPSGHVLNTLEQMGTGVYRTDLSEKGIRVTLTAAGERAEYCTWDTPAAFLAGVSIADADPANDMITVRNDGTADADLSGCSLVTERGGDLFLFPEGTTVTSGGTLVIGSRSSGERYDLFWDAKNVLHNKKKDAVILYDAHGTVICRFVTEP